MQYVGFLAIAGRGDFLVRSNSSEQMRLVKEILHHLNYAVPIKLQQLTTGVSRLLEPTV